MSSKKLMKNKVFLVLLSTLSLIFILFSALFISMQKKHVPNSQNDQDHQPRGAKFYPPPGKVLHIAGQDRESFADYVENVSRNGVEFGLPAGAAFYTSLELSGIFFPHANMLGDNHQDLAYLIDNYDDMVLQIGLYLHAGQLGPVGAGSYDDKIGDLADVFKGIKRPIFLRIGYEFDGPHNMYDPEVYKAAYRRIVDVLWQANVTNVAYVWHSYGMLPTYQGRDPMDWYPGDAYVDWVGISIFQISDEGYFQAHNRERILEIAREKQRPVMICESSAIRWTPEQKALSGQDYWDYWFKPYFDFIENNPEVKAFSIINCDWDSQRQFEGFNWGDCRIKSDVVVLDHWRAKMREERYLHSSSELYGLLVVS